MNGKNKKLLWFEAGILIITLITFSIGGSASVVNLLKNRPAQPTDIPWIDLKGPYKADKTGYLILDFYILYGTPPYNVTIDWGDGLPPENFTTNDGHVIAIHKYETCRYEPYRLRVWATDSVGGYARAETDVFFKCSECDLSVSVLDKPVGDHPFYCEDEEITFEITVKSTDNPDFCTCDQFRLSLVVYSPCSAPLNKTYGPIAPGTSKTIVEICHVACAPGPHTVKVTIIPLDTIDNYQENNIDTHDFRIISNELCYLLNTIAHFINKIFGFTPYDLYS